MKIKLACSLLLLLVPALASAQVTQRWVARYNGPANGHDIATAITVDSVGNSYVTGYSAGVGTGLDYATVKYDPAGIELWSRRFNGLGNGDDVPGAIAVDFSGNVYVTGYSFGGLVRSYDYATISYDTNGNVRWVATYNGPASLDDFASGLAVDGAGNVYVTGGSDGGIATGLDYATVAYDTNGIQVWEARYNGTASADDVAFAIALDSLSNVYVTGQSTGIGTGLDYATVGYNSTGVELYSARYDFAGGDDVAQAIVADAIGNVYVTGYSLSFLTGFDYATLAYSPLGVLQWESRYNGTANADDYAAAIGLDTTNGNVLVTGQSMGLGSNFDYATISYNAFTGFPNWTDRYDGPASGKDAAYAVAVDGAGNSYVTGYSAGLGTALDYATIAYNFVGGRIWVIRYDGQGLDDAALALTLDPFGNVYVTGFSDGIGTGHDYATIMYSQP